MLRHTWSAEAVCPFAVLPAASPATDAPRDLLSHAAWGHSRTLWSSAPDSRALCCSSPVQARQLIL